MSDKLSRYRSSDAPVPEACWAWNMYGAGVESIGRDGKPERVDVPDPAADQLLVRDDAGGMCYFDVKLINLDEGDKIAAVTRVMEEEKEEEEPEESEE